MLDNGQLVRGLIKMKRLYYPCIMDSKTGRINKQVSKQPMTRGQAEDFLKKNYMNLWLKCEAIPQLAK